jgi:hypothetical protein
MTTQKKEQLKTATIDSCLFYYNFVIKNHTFRNHLDQQPIQASLYIPPFIATGSTASTATAVASLRFHLDRPLFYHYSR